MTKSKCNDDADVGAMITHAIATGKIKCDKRTLNGHHYGSHSVTTDSFLVFNIPTSCLGKPGYPTRQQVQCLKAWLNDTTGTVPMVRDFPLQNILRGMYHHTCTICGQGDPTECTWLNGDHLQIAEPCPYPHGMPDTKLRLYVPSGKIVVANDLRYLFPTVEPKTNINYAIGRVLTAQSYAAVGMIHFSVGNTCPSMYRLGRDHFTVGTKPPKRGAKRVAGITTDLWWYSVVDHDEYLQRSQQLASDVNVVKCRPGVYEFCHHIERRSIETDNKPYTTIRWVATRPRKLPDYTQEYLKYNYTAGQVVRYCINAWPTLFREVHFMKGSQRATLQESVALVADHIFFVSGNGLQSHPNGWSGGCAEMGTAPPELKIPAINRPLPYVYPLTDHSFIAEAVGLGTEYWTRQNKNARPDGTLYLNPSFAALAFNLLRALLLYGRCPIDDVEEETARWVSTIELAKQCIVRLAEHYPTPKNCRELLEAIQQDKYQTPILTQRIHELRNPEE